MGQTAARLSRWSSGRSMTQRRGPYRQKSESTGPLVILPQPPNMHTCPSPAPVSKVLSHKPVPCLHTPCQAHRKGIKVLKPNFPFAPRRQILMKRPWRRK